MYFKSQSCELCSGQSKDAKSLPQYLTWISLFINVVLLLFLSAFSVQDDNEMIASTGRCVRPQLTKSPGTDHTIYERRRLHRNLDDNSYTGEPRAELDEAWGELVAPIVVQITPEEYTSARLADASLALADGSGYLAEMAVYHELHCIKRVRRHLHVEHYYPELASPGAQRRRERERFHVEHCLEYWREAAMCRADPTLTTMFWRDGVPTSRHYDDHECVNWATFDGWARSRIFNVSDLDALDQAGRWDLVSNEHGETLSVAAVAV